MINIGGNKEISRVQIIKDGAAKTISYVYYGSKLVWQAIRSCFGSGFWTNIKPWSNTEAWRNK